MCGVLLIRSIRIIRGRKKRVIRSLLLVLSEVPGSSFGIKGRLAGNERPPYFVLPIRKIPCAYTQNAFCLYAKFPRLNAKTNAKKLSDAIFQYRCKIVRSVSSVVWDCHLLSTRRAVCERNNR